MRLDATTVKQRAAGRWREILPALGGIDAGILDGKNRPCPRCGGRDRFRVIDMAAGVLFCNQCFNHDNGDGIAALMWLRGWDFNQTLAELARHLGIAPATAEPNPMASPRSSPPMTTAMSKRICSFRWCGMTPSGSSSGHRRPAAAGRGA